MKKFYTSSILSLALVLAACSKDFLKSYDTRIQGTWRLIDIDRYGFGSTTTPFRNGLFDFQEDGRLVYVNESGDSSTGSWNIERRWSQGNCYTDANGNRQCNDRYVRSLSISVINFATQELRSEFFDEINFTGTNRFNAQIYLGAGTCIFRFRRQ